MKEMKAKMTQQPNREKRPTRTKIICTMGPSVNSKEKILELIDAGMNVARLNFSHGNHEEHLRVITLLKEAREEKQVPLAIMVDTKGPEVRLGKIKNEQCAVSAKQRLCLVKEEIEGDCEKGIQLHPSSVIDELTVGMRLLIDDGYLIAHVVEKKANHVVIAFENAGILKSHKGVNVPGVHFDLPVLTEEDLRDLNFACKEKIDLIAASFVCSKEHVLKIKQLLIENQRPEILVLAKIENSLGVKNFDEILEVADGIMVARGDLGVEMPLPTVPHLQKRMIRKCCEAAKPVIIATQMLESMIKHPRPTRAEVSDVANAIYDSTSAVTLSGETAVGDYPIEVVKMMKSTIEETEKDFNYREFFERHSSFDYHDVSNSVALASVRTAYSAKATAIFCFTSSGFTARLVSRFRPEMPVIVLTSHSHVYHQLALYWGVIPIPPCNTTTAETALQVATSFALEKNLLASEDLVIVTSGSPFGISGTTNMMLVSKIL